MTAGALQTRHYERVFAVLERCDEAASARDLGRRLLAALADEFHLRHCTFFQGATFRTAFHDPNPLLTGRTPAMFPEYHERWPHRDAFATPEPVRLLRATNVASLVELPRLTEDARPYFQDFMFRHGLRSITGIRLGLAGGHHAMVGLFDPDPHAVGEPELAALRLLARQLNVISRNLPRAEPARCADNRLATLTRRQREVVELVADGMTNAGIAAELQLTEDTVKKYVSRALAATGCRGRTELALLAR